MIQAIKKKQKTTKEKKEKEERKCKFRGARKQGCVRGKSIDKNKMNVKLR